MGGTLSQFGRKRNKFPQQELAARVEELPGDGGPESAPQQGRAALKPAGTATSDGGRSRGRRN